MSVLIAGIGNLLRSDDGIGSRLIEYLNNNGVPEGVELLDAGTALWALLDEMVLHDAVIIVDAIEEEQGNVPGTITTRKLNLEREHMPPNGTHELGLGQMLALVHVRCKEKGRTDPQVIVVGVEPTTLDAGIRLSPEVEACVPLVAAMVIEECERLTTVH